MVQLWKLGSALATVSAVAASSTEPNRPSHAGLAKRSTIKAVLSLYPEGSCTSPWIPTQRSLQEGGCVNIDYPFHSFAAIPEIKERKHAGANCRLITYPERGCTGRELRSEVMMRDAGTCYTAATDVTLPARSVKMVCDDTRKSISKSADDLVEEIANAPQADTPEFLELFAVPGAEVWNDQCRINTECKCGRKKKGCGGGGDSSDSSDDDCGESDSDDDDCQPYICEPRTTTQVSCYTTIVEEPIIETRTERACRTSVMILTPVYVTRTSQQPVPVTRSQISIMEVPVTTVTMKQVTTRIPVVKTTMSPVAYTSTRMAPQLVDTIDDPVEIIGVTRPKPKPGAGIRPNFDDDDGDDDDGGDDDEYGGAGDDGGDYGGGDDDDGDSCGCGGSDSDSSDDNCGCGGSDSDSDDCGCGGSDSDSDDCGGGADDYDDAGPAYRLNPGMKKPKGKGTPYAARRFTVEEGSRKPHHKSGGSGHPSSSGHSSSSGYSDGGSSNSDGGSSSSDGGSGYSDSGSGNSGDGGNSGGSDEVYEEDSDMPPTGANGGGEGDSGDDDEYVVAGVAARELDTDFPQPTAAPGEEGEDEESTRTIVYYDDGFSQEADYAMPASDHQREYKGNDDDNDEYPVYPEDDAGSYAEDDGGDMNEESSEDAAMPEPTHYNRFSTFLRMIRFPRSVQVGMKSAAQGDEYPEAQETEGSQAYGEAEPEYKQESPESPSQEPESYSSEQPQDEYRQESQGETTLDDGAYDKQAAAEYKDNVEQEPAGEQDSDSYAGGSEYKGEDGEKPPHKCTKGTAEEMSVAVSSPDQVMFVLHSISRVGVIEVL